MIAIKTNNVPRNLIYGYELTEAEKADFDYIDDIEAHEFFRYRGAVYDPCEFIAAVRTPHCDNFNETIASWDGYSGDSFFSGVVIRYTNDCEQVIVGTYFS